MIHLFYFLSFAVVCTYFSKQNCTSPPKSLFDKLSVKSSLWCLHVGGESNNSKAQGLLWSRKKTKNFGVDRKALLLCVMSNCCNYKRIDVDVDVGFLGVFFFAFRFLLYASTTPAASAHAASSPTPVCPPTPTAHPSPLSLHHLCHCQSPRRAYKVPELWSVFICQERHWTWPVIKPWQRTC